METKWQVRQVAILGAGVMGAQIAAHFNNVGFGVLLYDLASEEGNPTAIANNAIKKLTKLKPSPVADKPQLHNIQAKNYQDHLEDLSQCDLIIEAVAERLDIKKSVYDMVAPHVKEGAILVSNTSGLSINTLGELLPETLQSRFCGVHFFNPPRYMQLLELIPSDKTSQNLLATLETFFVRYIGKGVLVAKDTPNFIANRIGVFSMLATIHQAEQFKIPFHIVDALTGVLLGRPKSATFRTMDVVGLDTMIHVVNTMKENLQDSPWHAFYTVPAWLTALIDKGALGQKTRAGIYKKEGKEIKVLSLDEMDYVSQTGEVEPQLLAILKEKDLTKRFQMLKDSDLQQAKFLWACFRDVFHYCAYHLETIANTPRDIDLAIRWGFGWQQGPLETWQQAGFEQIKQAIQEDINDAKAMVKSHLPSWLDDIDAFYSGKGSYNPSSKQYQPRSDLPVYQRQLTFDMVIEEQAKEANTLLETDAVKLWSFDNEVAILSFKSKANCIGSDVLQGMMQAIDFAEEKCTGLVIWQQSLMNFSVGANLKQFVNSFTKEKATKLKEVVSLFQQVAMRLKYCAIPTVAAVRGRALGGGCEMLMQCDDVVASLESYVGLVEVGVGLLPAGGGLKELALRSINATNNKVDFATLEQSFKAVAMAEVSSSASEAIHKRFFKDSAEIVMNTHEVLMLAIERAKALALNNYLPPVPKLIPAHGREAIARLNMLVVNMAKGGFISEHDAMIAEKITYVICGGDLDEGQLVDEAWFLRLEIEAFAELAQTEKTKARVMHLLETGKPLRN